MSCRRGASKLGLQRTAGFISSYGHSVVFDPVYSAHNVVKTADAGDMVGTAKQFDPTGISGIPDIYQTGKKAVQGDAYAQGQILGMLPALYGGVKTTGAMKFVKAAPEAIASESIEAGPGISAAAASGEVISNVPGRVQSRINITKEGWTHIKDRHYYNKRNASQFRVSEETLREILSSKDVVNTPITRTLESDDGMRYVRDVEFTLPIGLDKMSNWQPTSKMSILTDKYGNLVTASPGVVKNNR